MGWHRRRTFVHNAGFFAILALSYLYVVLREVPAIEGLFFGLKAAVLAIVAQALGRIAGRALRNGVAIAIGTMAFVALAIFNIPFPVVVLGAGLIGYRHALGHDRLRV